MMNLMKVLTILAGMAMLLGAAFAAYDCNGTLALWHLDYATGLIDDPCGGNDGTNLGADRNQAGYINKSFDFEKGDLDRATFQDNDSMDLTAANALTVAAWVMLESSVSTGWIYDKGDNTVEIYGVFYSLGEDKHACFINDGVDINLAYCATNAQNAQWERVLCIFNSTHITAYCNGTMGDRFARNTTSVANANNITVGARKQGAGFNRNYDGLIDHIRVYDHSLEPYEVQNDFLYGNISGIPGAPVTKGCNITLTDPINGTVVTSSSSPTFTANLTCFVALPKRCSVNMNGTESGQRTSGFVNNSAFTITANATKANGFYYWNVTCVNNSAPAYSNSSSTENFTLNVSVVTITIVNNVNVDVSSETHDQKWTRAACQGSTIIYVFERDVCIGSSCQTIQINESQYCLYGCIQGAKTCNKSLIAENSWLLIAFPILLIIGVITLFYRKWGG